MGDDLGGGLRGGAPLRRAPFGLFVPFGSIVLVVALSFPLPAAGGPEERLVGIAPMEADLEAMRQTLRALESAVESRSPSAADSLLSPAIPEPARLALLEVLRARVAALPAGARYELRSDIGPGAVVPIGPDRVSIQVTGTVLPESGDDVPEAVNLELEAVEGEGRRRWLLRTLAFSSVRLGPTPRRVALWAAAGAAGLLLVLFTVIVLVRRRRAA